MEFSECVRIVREERGLSLKEISAMAGASCTWLKPCSNTAPRLSTVETLAKALDLRFDKIRGWHAAEGSLAPKGETEC
jgi:transcriptional regulator with XRE-family HTH domain